MKLKPMVLTELCDETVAVPVGETAEVFRGVIKLNKTALFIWRGIEAGKTAEEIAADLVANYDGVELPHARECVEDLIQKLRDGGILEE